MKRDSYSLKEKLAFQAMEYSRLRVLRHSKPRRKCFGVKYSENHGETWRLVAICDECFHSIEPPNRASKIGDAGVNFCDCAVV